MWLSVRTADCEISTVCRYHADCRRAGGGHCDRVVHGGDGVACEVYKCIYMCVIQYDSYLLRTYGSVPESGRGGSGLPAYS